MFERKCPDCSKILTYSIKGNFTRATKENWKCSSCGCKRKTSISERFWSKVDKNGPIPTHCPELGRCWVWMGGKSSKGYGKFDPKCGEQLAHRYSYALFTNKIISKELCVCHHCDNPSCVNPNHLFLGTNQDNVNDKTNKNRNGAPKGELHHNSKLTEENIKFIRNSQLSHRQLALLFNTPKSNITSIKNYKSWKHIQ